MNARITGLSLLAAALLGSVSADAAQPVFTKLRELQRGGSLERLSDNGLWAVGYGKSPISELGYSYPRLYNVKTKEMTWLYKEGDQQKVAEMMAKDVTNDGKTVVGQYNGKPATWNADTKEWTILPYNSSAKYTTGTVNFITPDGKYALGTVYNGWDEAIVMWDLSGATARDITPDNLPLPITMYGTAQEYSQIRPLDLSPDGKKFTGLVGYSYAGADWTFLYDMETSSWSGVGFDVVATGNTGANAEVYKFTPKYSGYAFLEGGQFSHSSNQIIGAAYTDDDQDAIFTMDLATGEVKIVADSKGLLFGSIDNNGVIYASSPAGNSIRDWYAMVGKYWYDIKQVVKQAWGIDWQGEVSQDDYGYSGTFVSAADDGLSLLSVDYSSTPYETYVVELPEPLSEVAKGINLLDNYYVTPVNNSAFAQLSEVKVTFDREIDVKGQYNAVKLLDSKGNVVATSISLGVDPGDSRVLAATFRNRRLEVGENYTVVFPAGVCTIKGDAEKVNGEISVNYTGRPAAPVAATTIAPASGTAIQRINAQSNPIVITFDAEVAPVEKEAGQMYLYRLDDEGKRERICQLSGSTNGKSFVVFPVMEQRLAKGSNYQVVIEANVVADISGADPNEEIVIDYVGSYIPNPSIGSVIFADDFNGGLSTNNWMLWDGDGLEPNSEMQSWGFYTGLPWWLARDDVGTNEMAAVSHSMYSEPGKSDDWMVTNQLYISDDTAVLTFKSQSYRNSANDVLKVYVYETSDIITALTETLVNDIRYKGDLVYEQKQTPGANEETLAGDWTENVIKLDKYAGKTIYVAFVNDNRNQSAIFIDDVSINRDIKFSMVNLTPESVLTRDEVSVSGILNIESESDTYTGYTLRLLDGEGKELSTISDATAELKKGWSKEFTFPETLPLTVGAVNPYTIDINIGGELTDRLNASVQDLAVQTTKKVVIEKFTGQGCTNCPLGIISLGHIEEDFKDQAITLAYHCYTGDSFNTPKANAMSTFLGMSAAPTARINRGEIVSPMFVSDATGYIWKNNGLWYDHVAEQLNTLAPADITVTSYTYDEDKNEYKVTFSTKYALDMTNANVNVLAVITEDDLVGSQSNNLYGSDDPNLGEWGKGGKYGSASVQYVFDDVVRTWEGATANGTGGFIPATIRGGQEYIGQMTIAGMSRILEPKNTKVTVMLIDAETGRILNADRNYAGFVFESVDNIAADSDNIKIGVQGQTVVVSSNGYAEALVYGLDGSLVARAQGEGLFSFDTSYHGVAIVRVHTANGVVTKKVMIK